MSTVNLQDMFSQYQREDEVTILEEGVYILEVARCSVRGDAGLLPIYRVIGGPYNGKTAMCGTMTLSDKSRSIFFRNLKGFGINEEFIQQCSGFKDIADALVGRVVEMKVQKKPFQGQDRNSFPIGGVRLADANAAPVQQDTSAAQEIAAPTPATTQPVNAGAVPPPPPPPPVGGTSNAPF